MEFTDDAVRIGYALWEVSLPAQWVAARPDVASFLRGATTRNEVRDDAEASAVLALLEAQGCIVDPPLRGDTSLRALRARFDRLRSTWYAAYYAHPMWGRLRSGVADRRELLAYLVHNYHVSRAAGSVAARMATRGPERWRAFFREDARGEFWHCDAYYFVQSELLGCPAHEVKAYVPLPGSTAFEQHALRLAETDGVAHLLVAYFQESSVVFREDSDAFYAEVERAYGLAGFFRPWQAHIGIDVAEAHAAGLAALFADDVAIAPRAAARAVSRAWAAFFFLRASLDDVMAQARTGGAPPLRTTADGHYDVASLVEAYAPRREIARRDDAYVTDAVASSAMAALASAREHDEIIIAGRVADALGGRAVSDALPSSPWALAVANYLAESASRPLVWGALVLLLARRFGTLGVDVRELTRRLGDTPATAIPGLAVELARFDELVERWTTSDATFPDDLCPWE